MLRNSKFETEEIEREKGVIVEEMNMYFDTPRDFIGGVYDQLLYGDQPLGWDIIGRKETVARRDARHVPRLHRPLVQARADGRRPRRQARRRPHSRRSSGCSATSSRRRRGAPAAGRRSSADGGPRVKIHHKESDQAHLCLGVPQLPARPPGPLRAPAARDVLGTGMSSRLFTEVRERRGLAYYVFAHNQSYTDAGSLYSQAGVDINRIDEAVETIARELRKIADEAVPPTSSRRRARSRRGASSSGSRARRG